MAFTVFSRALALGCALFATQAMAQDRVHLGAVGNSGDVAFLIAKDKGYFKDENLNVEITVFDSGARMIAPLGTGDLDVGSGAASVGLYNAAERKIDIRVVADRGRTAPGYLYQTLTLRKDLVESGRVKTYADLKGLKFAAAAPGVTSMSVLNEALKKGGLKFSDVEMVFLGFPQQMAAMRNKAIDGAIMIEPFATALSNSNDAVRWQSTEDFYKNNQISMVFYGDKFARERPEVATRFMKAYLRGIRDYNDALENGQWAKTPKAEEVLAILSKNLNIKVEQIRGIYPHAVSTDGKVNVESMQRDLQFFKDRGDVPASASVEKLVDMSFVDAALKALGPYKPAR